MTGGKKTFLHLVNALPFFDMSQRGPHTQFIYITSFFFKQNQTQNKATKSFELMAHNADYDYAKCKHSHAHFQ